MLMIGVKIPSNEVLNKKKSLTLEMVRRLTSFLEISASVLIQEYPLAAKE